MASGIWKRKEFFPQDNFLLYIPKKKHTTWEKKSGRIILIFHHDKAAEKFLRWLVKKPLISDIELDELGSVTWELIDGKNTIHDISKKLVDHFGDKCQPVNDRLILFLRYLNKKAWISFDRNQAMQIQKS